LKVPTIGAGFALSRQKDFGYNWFCALIALNQENRPSGMGDTYPFSSLKMQDVSTRPRAVGSSDLRSVVTTGLPSSYYIHSKSRIHCVLGSTDVSQPVTRRKLFTFTLEEI
jgi:hypothetical protein